MKILFLNQAFWPDVVASGQQVTMLAQRLTERGHRVTVIAGARGYDDSSVSFPRRERWNSIDVIRLSTLSAGKRRRWERGLSFGSFMVACAVRLAFLPKQDVVIALTSPPLISWLASVFVRLRGGELIFWPLDLNPDEAIAAGWLNENSFSAKFLTRLLTSSMKTAKTIIALDDFMKQRMVAKGIASDKVDVIPPAPYDSVSFDSQGREAFRRTHGLTGKFVVMYAGNHSPCHPLDTLLQAARELKDRTDIIFLFVGGGSELRKVKSFASQHAANIRCLNYLPHEQLSALLSAADLHTVVMGDAFNGIVHPSKIYNILKLGKPFLFIGPDESFATRIISAQDDRSMSVGVRHGETVKAVAAISNFVQQQNGGAKSFYHSPALSDFTKFIAHIEALDTKSSLSPATERPDLAASEVQ
ncbi:MAG TPA: glycosyltransferase family 4 protein [Pyrinomonadaceae bacterium]|nr:glycosyltransferase family 4 protein [Pyrinomonadaceae bacterium]